MQRSNARKEQVVLILAIIWFGGTSNAVGCTSERVRINIISFCLFHIGKALCLLGREDFMARLPKNGDLLYNALQKLVHRSQSKSFLCLPMIRLQRSYRKR